MHAQLFPDQMFLLMLLDIVRSFFHSKSQRFKRTGLFVYYMLKISQIPFFKFLHSGLLAVFFPLAYR